MTKIIAVDFDGTLCEHKYPAIGAPNIRLIGHLKAEQKRDAKLILWTCRMGKTLDEAVSWCMNRGLRFNAVNENINAVIKEFGGDSRKIFADEYIDDRANHRFKLPNVRK